MRKRAKKNCQGNVRGIQTVGKECKLLYLAE